MKGKKSATATAAKATKAADDDAPIAVHDARGDAPEPTEAHAAYESRKRAWKARGGVELGPPRVNLAYVTARVIQIGNSLSEPATLSAFDALTKVPLPGGASYDAAPVRLLPTVARALWYARSQYLTADAQSSTVSLPPALVTEVPIPDVDVSKVRHRMGLTQTQFATKFGFRPATLRSWEQGRVRPDSPTRVLLALIAKHPESVEDVLQEMR